MQRQRFSIYLHDQAHKWPSEKPTMIQISLLITQRKYPTNINHSMEI